VALFAFPGLAFATRIAVHYLALRGASTSDIPKRVAWAESSAIFMVALILGNFMSSITTILGFVGSLSSTAISLIMPTMLYLHTQQLVRTRPMEIGAYIVLGAGVFICIAGTISTVLDNK
jgi:hypothetical protein